MYLKGLILVLAGSMVLSSCTLGHSSPDDSRPLQDSAVVVNETGTQPFAVTRGAMNVKASGSTTAEKSGSIN